MKRILPKKHIIPIAIFLFSLVLRIALISKGPYHGDTIALIVQAEKTIETLQLQKQSALGFPLIVMLSSLFIYVFRFFSWGNAIVAVNSVSVIFSSFAVLAFYFLSLEVWEHLKKREDKDFEEKQRISAIIGSLLFSVSPIFLGLSVYGKNHAPCMFFLVWGTCQLLCYLRLQKKKNFILSILGFGLMGATRLDIIVLAIPFSFGFLFLYTPTSQETEQNSRLFLWIRILKKLLLWWLSVFACIAIFYIPFFFHESFETFRGEIQYYYNTYLVNNYLGLFSYKLFRTFGYMIKNFTATGLFITVLGFFLLFKSNKHLMFFLLLWTLFPFFQYGNLLTTVSSRYFVILIPPVILAMSFAFTEFIKKNSLIKYLSILALLAVGLSTFLHIYPLLKIRHDNDDVPSFVRWFEQTAKPNAHMIHTDGSIFFKYFSNVPLIRRPLSADPIDFEELESFRLEVDNLIRQGIPVYINDASLYSYNFENNFSNFIFKHYRLEYLGQHYYEDWHSGAMANKRFSLKVYQLHIKEFRDENDQP